MTRLLEEERECNRHGLLCSRSSRARQATGAAEADMSREARTGAEMREREMRRTGEGDQWNKP